MKWYTFGCNTITAILEGCAVKHSRHSSLAASEFSWTDRVKQWNSLRTLVLNLLWKVSFIFSSLSHLSFFPLYLTPLSPPFSHIPSHSFYVLSLSLMFKQLVNAFQNCPPCYGDLLHSFSVKIDVICERKQLYINMAFTYNTWWNKVLYEKFLVTLLVKEVSYLFRYVYPEGQYCIHNSLPNEKTIQTHTPCC